MNIPDSARNDLKDLIAHARSSPLSDFYRIRWGSAEEFGDLPLVSRRDFAEVPLSSRRYKQEKGMVKIIGRGDETFLSEWSFSDIRAEAYAERSPRPMVYMSDPYDAIEKSIWCYEHGMTPLLGEKDPDMAIYAAARYRIDSLITDSQSLGAFMPFFTALQSPLASITVIDSGFDPGMLMPIERYARVVTLVLALPETGVIARAPLSRDPRFAADESAVIERDSGLIVTKLRALATPIIRYMTPIEAELEV